MSGMRCSRPCCRVDQVGEVGCMMREAQLPQNRGFFLRDHPDCQPLDRPFDRKGSPGRYGGRWCGLSTFGRVREGRT
jgi:hypothetical protein